MKIRIDRELAVFYELKHARNTYEIPCLLSLYNG